MYQSLDNVRTHMKACLEDDESYHTGLVRSKARLDARVGRCSSAWCGGERIPRANNVNR